MLRAKDQIFLLVSPRDSVLVFVHGSVWFQTLLKFHLAFLVVGILMLKANA